MERTYDATATFSTEDISTLLVKFKCTRDELERELTVQRGASQSSTGLFWDCPEFDDPIRQRVKLMFASTEEGILACLCGSFRTLVQTKQTRSGDEAMTVFATCTDCGRKWKQ